MVARIGAVELLVAIKALNSSTLLALLAVPVAVLLVFQLYPVATPENVTGVDV
jgi:hypothetical protein